MQAFHGDEVKIVASVGAKLRHKGTSLAVKADAHDNDVFLQREMREFARERARPGQGDVLVLISGEWTMINRPGLSHRMIEISRCQSS